jgi:hypothetical protein
MKKMIWGGLAIGSTIGGAIPFLWTLNPFSFSSIFLTAIGGVIGIWCGYKLAKVTGAS